MNGRITYVDGKRNFIMDENAFGVTPVGAQNQQILVGGDASRPSVAGDLAISLYPGTRLTLVNNTSVNSTRIDGTSDYEQFDLATQTASFVSFRYLGMRTIANATDLHYRVRNWFAVYGGYHYSDRRIKDIEDFAVDTPLSGASFEQMQPDAHRVAGHPAEAGERDDDQPGKRDRPRQPAVYAGQRPQLSRAERALRIPAEEADIRRRLQAELQQ